MIHKSPQLVLGCATNPGEQQSCWPSLLPVAQYIPGLQPLSCYPGWAGLSHDAAQPWIINVSLTPHPCSVYNENRPIALPSWTLVESLFPSVSGILSGVSRRFVYVPLGKMVTTCACHSLLGIMVSLSHWSLRPSDADDACSLQRLIQSSNRGSCMPFISDSAKQMWTTLDDICLLNRTKYEKHKTGSWELASAGCHIPMSLMLPILDSLILEGDVLLQNLHPKYPLDPNDLTSGQENTNACNNRRPHLGLSYHLGKALWPDTCRVVWEKHWQIVERNTVFTWSS